MDRQGTGVASKKDMYRMLKAYNTHVSSNVNVERLIARYEKKGDRALGEAELCSLMSVREACASAGPAETF